MEYSDEKIVHDYISGDENSLEILFRRYLRSIYSFAYRYIGNPQGADDITQETFVKVWKNINRFDLKKSFKTWIFEIAKNTSIDFLKKKKLLPLSEIENEEGGNLSENIFIDQVDLPDDILQKKDIEKKLNDAIMKLELKYRTVLLLYLNNGVTFQEISEILKEPLNTVKSRYKRAVDKLKKSLV
jgi:RNA polymerase sigma-70 factor (ECF subfamily)